MIEKVRLIEEDGKEKDYEVLVTFKVNNKDIVIYTDYEKDENNNINCYASYINNKQLSEITNKEDIEKVNEVIKTIMEGMK